MYAVLEAPGPMFLDILHWPKGETVRAEEALFKRYCADMEDFLAYAINYCKQRDEREALASRKLPKIRKVSLVFFKTSFHVERLFVQYNPAFKGFCVITG
jgi:hypothetical protein